MRQFAGDIQTKTERHASRLRRELEQQHQISGSAVIPNPEADPQWIEEQKKIMATYAQRLEEEKADA